MKANSPWIIPIAVSVILAVPFVAMMLTDGARYGSTRIGRLLLVSL